jgi:hypothetical protein
MAKTNFTKALTALFGNAILSLIESNPKTSRIKEELIAIVAERERIVWL